MACKTLLQVDQAESTHQKLLRYLGERCEGLNPDRRFWLFDRGNHQKAAESTGKSLHNFTGVERFLIRKKINVSAAYIFRLHKNMNENLNQMNLLTDYSGH